MASAPVTSGTPCPVTTYVRPFVMLDVDFRNPPCDFDWNLAHSEDIKCKEARYNQYRSATYTELKSGEKRRLDLFENQIVAGRSGKTNVPTLWLDRFSSGKVEILNVKFPTLITAVYGYVYSRLMHHVKDKKPRTREYDFCETFIEGNLKDFLLFDHGYSKSQPGEILKEISEKFKSYKIESFETVLEECIPAIKIIIQTWMDDGYVFSIFICVIYILFIFLIYFLLNMFLLISGPISRNVS